MSENPESHILNISIMVDTDRPVDVVRLLEQHVRPLSAGVQPALYRLSMIQGCEPDSGHPLTFALQYRLKSPEEVEEMRRHVAPGLRKVIEMAGGPERCAVFDTTLTQLDF